MNVDSLCAAAQNGRQWLDRFRLRTFQDAFREYTAQYQPCYAEAIQEAGTEEAALKELAERILDGLEQGWKKTSLWNRSAEKVDCKQVLVDYLSPMLLAMEAEVPGARLLCMLLKEGWAVRRPKDPYRVASYEELQKGFRNAIMGIDLNNRHIEAEQDR